MAHIMAGSTKQTNNNYFSFFFRLEYKFKKKDK